MFIPLHVQVALFVKNENSVRAVPLLRDLFCTQRRKKSLHFVWGLRNPLWIVSLASALSTLNSPNSLKQPTHSWIMLEQGIQRGEKFLWWNKIWIYYTPSGVIICLLLLKSLLLIFHDFQIFLKMYNIFKFDKKFPNTELGVYNIRYNLARSC